MKRKNKAILWCCITLLWTGVIFWFSLQPATASANLSGGLLQKLLGWFYQITAIQIPVERAHWLFRKAAHFGEFFLLGIFSGSFFHAIWKKTFPALLYGGCMCPVVPLGADEGFSKKKEVDSKTINFPFFIQIV